MSNIEQKKVVDTGSAHGPTETNSHNPFEELGHSLRDSLEKIGKFGTMGILAATILTGCSPQERSFYLNQYVPIPKPPAEARMQLGISTEADGDVFVNYVVWNEKDNRFERKDVHYSSSRIINGLNMFDYKEQGGYVQPILDGEVLYGNAVVDQATGKIILPGGNCIDGRTGNVITASGEVVKTLVH